MAIESNLPRWLIRALSVRFSIRMFVETGTLEGHTAAIASEIVPVVHTIEISPRMYEQALPEVKANKNITRHLGSSVNIIPKLIAETNSPILFYLDGHWSGIGPKLGPECPLLEELTVLRDRPRDVIVIDDARLFLQPPLPPHDPAQWPKIDDVTRAARGNVARHVIQVCDTIIASPEPLMVQY